MPDTLGKMDDEAGKIQKHEPEKVPDLDDCSLSWRRNDLEILPLVCPHPIGSRKTGNEKSLRLTDDPWFCR